MTKVGVIGLGMMGGTHLDVYAQRDDVEVVAISDANPRRLSGEASAKGNIEGQAQQGFDVKSTDAKRYDDGMALIDDPNVDLVDICLPTPLHHKFGLAALASGKHVLLEKPFTRTHAEAVELVKAADKADGMMMVAMCMRFWPEWVFLKNAVELQTYGKVRSAVFRRVASHPGGPFYSSGEQSGGALLDLHIHDVDFVQHLFGMPKSVMSRGYAAPTSAIDHVTTMFEYDDIPMVVAEGGWAMAPTFGFSMRYTVNFERATAVFDIGQSPTLTLHEHGRDEPTAPQVAAGMGYEHEIAYFLECIQRGTKPETVTPQSAADTIRIAEAEMRSVETGESVTP